MRTNPPPSLGLRRSPISALPRTSKPLPLQQPHSHLHTFNPLSQPPPPRTRLHRLAISLPRPWPPNAKPPRSQSELQRSPRPSPTSGNPKTARSISSWQPHLQTPPDSGRARSSWNRAFGDRPPSQSPHSRVLHTASVHHLGRKTPHTPILTPPGV